jgi:electron transfer flavoprotein beta subunit
MRVLVSVKQVLDYNLRPRVKTDGSGIDLSNVKLSMNPFDERAVEEAVRLKEKNQASKVVVVSAGPAKAQETLRTVLAMGADRAILIQTDRDLEPLAVAKLLCAVARVEQPDLILMGKQAIDDDCSQTGQMLAALMDLPQGTFASKLELADGEALVTREIDGGLETLALRLPAIVTTDLRLNAPRHASLPDIMRAKNKPLAIRTPAELGVDVSPRLDVLTIREPAKRKAGVKVASVEALAAAIKLLGVAA